MTNETAQNQELARPEMREKPTVILGAGPAGLTAARRAAREGLDVVLVDDRPEPGGTLTGTETIDGREYPTGGDVVTEVDGDEVTSAEDLQRAIDSHKPGDTITLTVSRDGESRTVEVTLDTRPS